LESWLDSDPAKHLSVFAYNDSVALYEGKPFVSATGGTWYRTGMMINDLGEGRKLVNTDLHKGIIQYRSTDEQILILRKQNPEREIFHTEQVELNGFIHSVLFGTGFESQGYEYFGEHAYEVYIKSDTVKF